MTDAPANLTRKRYFEPSPGARRRTKPTGAEMRMRVIEAMDQCWRDGKTFTIYLNNEGEVEVRKNGKLIYKYTDAGDALVNLFPDKKSMFSP